MDDKNKYLKIELPPYIEPELYYKNEKRLSSRGYGSVIILSIISLLVSIGIIILGVYLGI